MEFTSAKIKTLITRIYHLSGDIKELPGEIDLNYQLTTPDKRKYTFKIANPHEKLDILKFQNAMMLHLIAKNLGLDIPKVIYSKNKELITTIKDKKGKERLVRLLTWVEGRPFATVSPHSEQLLYRLGNLCAKLSLALKDFDHPAAHRFIKWDLAQVEWVKPHLDGFNGGKNALVHYYFGLYESIVKPIKGSLPKSVIYNDANDYNVLVGFDKANPNVPGVIDFGDAVYSHTINELAIALAYALMHKPDPLQAAYHIVQGYHNTFPLQDSELKVLFTLITIRLLISVVCSHQNLKENPDNTYLQISDEAAWTLMEKLRNISPAFAYYTFRHACGMEPCPVNLIFKDWIAKQGSQLKPIIAKNLENAHWLDLGMDSVELGNQSIVLDDVQLKDQIEKVIQESGKSVGLGKYNEVRPFYTSSAFEVDSNDGPAWRTVHLGLDVFINAGETVFAPLKGTIYSVADNVGNRNYGPTIILKHDILPELIFYTLYGHVDKSTLAKWKAGDKVKAGAPIGKIGDLHENGGWSPHLHFQIMLDTLEKKGDFPGVAAPMLIDVWKSICPDPWLLVTGTLSPHTHKNENAKLLSFRKQHLGKNLSLSYHKPLMMQRGYMQYLYEADGRKYLDTVNNVAHVGHEHPRVVSAGQKQMAVLNTNTRYLHKNIVAFTKKLLSTMPASLSVVYVVNSGSEANELALRIAKTYTKQKDMVVVEVGYHGNTNACVDISSYKFDRKGGKGAPDHVHVVPIPDTYRGIYRDKKDAGKKYASHIKEAIVKVQSKGKGIAGFICESVLSCGGQIVLPDGYLKEAYAHVREAGGVCIADEVQTGCGRAGDHFWAFQSQDVVPDIVTIGKPIGNGHPLGVVVTSIKLADAFANGMEYFNTFGGNPVSSAIGLEVLNVIKDKGLQQNAKKIGNYMKKRLTQLKNNYPIIGDVRGMGLFLGIELVKDNQLTPATEQATYLANRMRELGILMSTDGPFENVLKIKPPIIFNKEDSDFLLSTLDRVLKEDFMQMD
ncbi:MAG TPA: aminotransferase class III-fold pyridoxal phosphate-dependent enzyme [Cyclobacteriaceae bacterium]|nr:aminotransferase class III-fold pyridoxal phosphate-dependent enzyme [Cyclobacteriaceae bacterium]